MSNWEPPHLWDLIFEKKAATEETFSHSGRWDLPGAVGSMKVNEEFKNQG